MIDGKTLIRWGFTPGPWFGEALTIARIMHSKGESEDAIFSRMQEMQPPPIQVQHLRTNRLPFQVFLGNRP